ncbi:hypothetical protein [Kitasatospora sp. NPDC088346]|uniref:hypothetical protein n=1 Tax=Kitasatospora sp. NPDC088346 TaxID=3364073 RepID=UPI0037F58D0C
MQDPSQQPAPPPAVPPAGSPAPAGAGTSHAKLWATGAAVVSAAAGVATAFAAFSGGSSPAPVPPSSSVTVTARPQGLPEATAPSGQGPGGAGAASPSAGTGAVSVRWAGRMLIGLEGIDLEQTPPRKGSTSGLGFSPNVGRNGSSSMEVKGTVAQWTAAEAPTAQGCKDLLATQSRRSVIVGKGDRVCLLDEHSPIAALTVTGTFYDQGSYGLVEGDLTVWNLRPDR